MVGVGGREAQDTCCVVDLADVSYGYWFNMVLARFGCCSILVRNRVVHYRCHCSFDRCPRKMMWKWKESRGDSLEALCEHDPSLYEIIVKLSYSLLVFYLS